MKMLWALILITYHSVPVSSIRCYDCSSKATGKDYCGAYSKFDKANTVPVECSSDESPTPGTFCMKYVEQSPIGFIWEGRWRQVIRRCASVTESGVTGVCNWGVYDNGVYWEECSCSDRDGCNSGPLVKSLHWGAFLCATILMLFAA